MGDLNIPHGLSQASLALNLVDSLQKLLDPNERKKIVDDIKTHHALNETEARKAEDARALIRQHSAILEETKKISIANENEKKDIAQKWLDLKAETEKQNQAISAEKSKAKEASEVAAALHTKALIIQERAEEKERALIEDKSKHDANVQQFIKDKTALEKQKSDIDEYKNSVIALDKNTKEKVEKLKQFNF